MCHRISQGVRYPSKAVSVDRRLEAEDKQTVRVAIRTHFGQQPKSTAEIQDNSQRAPQRSRTTAKGHRRDPGQQPKSTAEIQDSSQRAPQRSMTTAKEHRRDPGQQPKSTAEIHSMLEIDLAKMDHGLHRCCQNGLAKIDHYGPYISQQATIIIYMV